MAPEMKEVKGDLFSCRASSSLAHCISADVRMGKGVAAIFKRRFGGVAELLAQKKSVGDVAVLKPKPTDDRYVYYLITKSRFWEKPTYDDLASSLRAMRVHCHANGVKHLAMPKIGCGLDGLDWKKVRSLLDDIFMDESCSLETITIYYI